MRGAWLIRRQPDLFGESRDKDTLIGEAGNDELFSFDIAYCDSPAASRASDL